MSAVRPPRREPAPIEMPAYAGMINFLTRVRGLQAFPDSRGDGER